MCKLLAALLLTYFGYSVRSTTALGQESSARKAQPASPAKVKFENMAMGEIVDEDHVHLGFTNYRGSDGSTLMVLYETFDSPTAAQRYFEKRISKATKVIERKKRTDGSGKVVGERAEILRHFGDEKTIPSVLWIDGSSFHEICSESRKALLSLEAAYKH